MAITGLGAVGLVQTALTTATTKLAPKVLSTVANAARDALPPLRKAATTAAQRSASSLRAAAPKLLERAESHVVDGMKKVAEDSATNALAAGRSSLTRRLQGAISDRTASLQGRVLGDGVEAPPSRGRQMLAETIGGVSSVINKEVEKGLDTATSQVTFSLTEALNRGTV